MSPQNDNSNINPNGNGGPPTPPNSNSLPEKSKVFSDITPSSATNNPAPQHPITGDPSLNNAAQPNPGTSFTPQAPANLSGPVVVDFAGDTGQTPQLGATPSAVSANHPPVKPSKKKVLLISGGGLVVLLVLLGYFFYYLPNKPSTIWKQAMTNSAKGYDRLVAYANKEQTATYKGYHETGSLKLTSNGSTISGDLTGGTDGTNSSATLKLKTAGATFSFDLLSVKKASNKSPDIYARVTGIKTIASTLGGPGYDLGPKINGLEGKWVSISHTYIDSVTDNIKNSLGGKTSAPTLTRADIISSAEALGSVSKDYMFTTNPSKSVTKVTKNVGKEKLDGRSVYHYKVGFSKDNLLAYAAAMHDTLPKTKLGTWLEKESGQPLDKVIDYPGIQDSIKKLGNDASADVFVDLQTKLIRTVRFSSKDDPTNNYLDFILDYTGGTKYPFAISTHSSSKAGGSTDSVAFKLTTIVDSSDKSTEVKLDFSITPGSTINTLVNADFKITPSNDPVNITVPTQTVPFTEALNDLGLLDTYNAALNNTNTSLTPISAPATTTL